MSLTRRRWLGLSPMALAVPLHAQVPAASDANAPWTELERRITEEMTRQGIPGLSAAVARGDRVAWSRGFGLADLENLVPARPATAYRTASVAKPMTAVAAMQLVERNRLDLDAPIQRYVPSFPQSARPVTVRLLLAHLGGVRNYRSREEMESAQRYTSVTAALRQFAGDRLEHEPGSRYHYSTFGYVLAGAAVEAAAGVPFADLLRRSVLQPAGMTQTDTDDVHRLIPFRAAGYRRSTDGRLENAALADTSNKVPGGGLVSTAEDLARFAIAVWGSGLVSEQSRELMWTPQKTTGGELLGYGLGWAVSSIDQRRQVGHDGSQAGVATMLVLLPAERVALAVMCNAEGAAMGPFRDLLRLLA